MVGAEHAVTDFREITENPDIDIVDICSPNDKHYEAIMSAIAHGKHIYCDKPLTQELSDALAIPFAAAAFGMLVGLLSGYFPARRATRIRAIEAMKTEG